MANETITKKDVEQIKHLLKRIAVATEAMAKKADPSFRPDMSDLLKNPALGDH